MGQSPIIVVQTCNVDTGKLKKAIILILEKIVFNQMLLQQTIAIHIISLL